MNCKISTGIFTRLVNREVFERRLNVPRGSQGVLARLLGKSETIISQQLNANHERVSDAYRFLSMLWALDQIDKQLGDSVLKEVLLERANWLVTDFRPKATSHELTKAVGDAYSEAVGQELQGSSLDDQIRRYHNVAEAIQDKLVSLRQIKALK